MESALVVVVVAVLFGGMVLMLAMGYQNSEAERARQARARQAAAARASAIVSVPSFFASADGAVPPSQSVFNDAMVNQLEHHVRLEQAVVAQFVHQPSVDNLYRRAGTSLHAQ